MSKKQYSHQIDKNGRVKVVEATLPRHLRDHDEYSTHTFREGPLKRWLNRR
jgi:hypothetical protein